MKLKYIVIVIVAIMLISGVIKLISISNESTNPDPLPQITEINLNSTTSDKPINSNKYVQYSKNALESNTDKRRILYFYANWCPTCRPADENFKANTSKIPENVVIIRVNYNDTETDSEEKVLANKYAVTYQHTFVQIDTEGNKVSIWNGGQIEEILKHIQ